jgi:EAL domain-containing protein (putative c-di-GMP-specific phosphodiesterase class I)
MTGDAPDALQLEASERGAVGFLKKPFEVAELDAMLDLMAPARIGSPEWPEIIRVPTLDVILKGSTLSAVFQPIVRLSNGEQLGYEALTRNDSASALRNPEALFRYAARKNRIVDLEVVCLRNSLRAAAELPQASPVFINIHPSVFASGHKLHDAVVSNAERSGIELRRVVLEITEQGSLGDEHNVVEAIRNLKALGVRFAFDDIGVAFSHLPFIDQVRPAFLKISQHFGTGFELDATKGKIVRNALALANDFDSELIVEGIETAATAAAASALGIKYGQGFHFAQPAPAATFLRPALSPR